VLSWDSRRARRSGRARRRPDLAAVEVLERRELLAFTPLGHSLPDLTISGFASPVTSWGHNETVTVDVHNIGAATLPEPLNQAQGAPNNADAPASKVGIYMTNRPRFVFPSAGTKLIGGIDVPAIPENSELHVTSTFTMPLQPAGFPGDGGKIYIWFVANLLKTFPEMDYTNNISHTPAAVTIEAPFPELVAVNLDVPPVMQPGDTIAPVIRVANLGPVDTAPQGPVTVDLVASVTPSFGPGSSIVASYTVPNIPGVTQTATKAPVLGDTNVDVPANIVTINGAPVTLPTSPAKYFIGVVVDPNNQIKQIQGVGAFRSRHNPFSLSHPVGPPIPGLPPAGVVQGVVVPNPVFPFPITGMPVGAGFNSTTTASSTTFPIPVFLQPALATGQGAPVPHNRLPRPFLATIRGIGTH
jgi:hypothetical protein